MRDRPTALCWYDIAVTETPTGDSAEMFCLAMDLGYDAEMAPQSHTIPFVDVVRAADVDILIIPAPKHLDGHTLAAVRAICAVETVWPRTTFDRHTPSTPTIGGAR